MKKSLIFFLLSLLAISIAFSADDELSEVRMQEKYCGVYVYDYHYLVDQDHPLMVLCGPETKLYKYAYTKEYLEIKEFEEQQAEALINCCTQTAEKALEKTISGPTNFYHSNWVCQAPDGYCDIRYETSGIFEDNTYWLDLGGKVRWKIARVAYTELTGYVYDWIEKDDWIDEKFYWY